MKWKDKVSGVIISLPDTETPSMLQHPAYDQVKEEDNAMQREGQETAQKVKRARVNKTNLL